MLLKELLRMMDRQENVQVCISMFGTEFESMRWVSDYLEDEETEELIEKKVKKIRIVRCNGENVNKIYLE